MKKIAAIGLIFFWFASCNNEQSTDYSNNSSANTLPAPENITYNIIAVHPHDTSSYTQGFIWHNNTLYEGTGLEGHSRLIKTDLKTGKAVKTAILDPHLFGEGITILNDKIYQLTWQNHKVLVYNLETFEKIKEFTWDHEGWGITHNGKDLIISTGSNNLYLVDPETFKIKSITGVSDNNGPVGNLNELEYINGSVYANIYLTDYVVKINPAGQITGRIDFSGLLQKSGIPYDPQKTDVLNGIAYDSTRNVFFITGKKWPALFEIKLNK